MYSTFKPEKLQEFLPYFIEGIEDILLAWCTRSATSTLMQQRNLSEDDMVNVIGIRILSYTFDIIEQTESLKFCPYAKQLVEFFDRQHIKINELFLIYMDLSAVVREYLFAYISATPLEIQKILEDFSIIFEYNLSDVLHIYFELQLEKIEKEQDNVRKERKLLEDYRKIVDTINGVVVTDSDGMISFVNEKFCEYSGYRKEFLIGRTFYPIKHPDNDTEFYKQMWHDIKTKHLFQGVIKNRKRDRSTYYVESTIAPIVDTKTNETHYIALQRNITKEIEQEVQLQYLRDKEENLRLQHMSQKKIDELLELLPLPAFTFSHENLILKYNERFLAIFDPFEQRDVIQKLTSSTQELYSLLSVTSQKNYDAYSSQWVLLYNELYESTSPLEIHIQGDYNQQHYKLKISLISKKSEPMEALVCLETLK